MTQDRITRALARAQKDYRHAVAMTALAFSDQARKRHERRARVAEGRMRDLRHAMASGWGVEA